MDFVTLALVALATARLTRLVTTDTITEPLRVWVVGKLGEDSKLSYLMMCSWCMSLWVGAGVAGSAYLFGGNRWYGFALLALSASYVTGWLAGRENE